MPYTPRYAAHGPGNGIVEAMALKSLDIFFIHGFPVGLIQCESNLLGITSSNGLSVGSGGWTNIVEKYTKAKALCEQPFEIRNDGNRKIRVTIPNEWIGDASRDRSETRSIVLYCADSAQTDLAPNSLDAVFTDPPYFRSVQYAELMDFCYVWLASHR